MDRYDLKVFLETVIIIIGLVVNFVYINVYINEKNDRKDMKEQIMPVTTVNADGISFQTSQYIPENSQIKYKVLLENGKELNVSQDIWNKVKIEK